MKRKRELETGARSSPEISEIKYPPPSGLPIMSERLDRLRTAQVFRDFHHKALWEEEKHFTWLNSIILSAQIVILTSEKFDNAVRVLVLIFVSIIGIFFSLIAFMVLRKESSNFHATLSTFNEAHFAVFGGVQANTDASANKSLCRLISVAVRGKATIRDYFQLVCIIFVVAFVAIPILYYFTRAATFAEAGSSLGRSYLSPTR